MGAPGFWDDPESAAKVSAEHTRAQRRLDAFTRLQSDAADLEGLVEIAEEDEDLAGELEDAFASVEERLAALEEERLFAGSYDAGDALVTVNAGAGGTDAQDWAEMVLRISMRTGSTRPRRASTGSCGSRRSTPPTAGRRRSPASRSPPWSRRPATS
jgi:peptide chain release factor 2